jgi:predicted N-acetyltransferase YhbS
VRLWPVTVGCDRPALLLGPLAVHPNYRNRGVGSALMKTALKAAESLGHAAVLLVGDEPYYRRFGFARALTEQLRLPGPVDRDRFLARELVRGALENARGLVTAAGNIAPASAKKSTGIAARSLTSRIRRAS